MFYVWQSQGPGYIIISVLETQILFRYGMTMIGRQIPLRGWKTEGEPSVQEWAAEMAREAAFEKMSYKQFGRMDIYVHI